MIKIMKKIAAWALMVASMALFACGANPVVGTWYEYSTKSGKTITYTFNEDGTGSSTGDVFDYNFTWESTGNSVSMDIGIIKAELTLSDDDQTLVEEDGDTYYRTEEDARAAAQSAGIGQQGDINGSSSIIEDDDAQDKGLVEEVELASFEDVSEEVYKLIGDSDSSCTEKAVERIAALYGDGIDNGKEIYEKLEDENLLGDDVTSGILVCTVEDKAIPIDGDTFFPDYDHVHILKLDLVDSDNGNFKRYRTFSTENAPGCEISTYYDDYYMNTSWASRWFNSDMTQVTATMKMDSGEEHVGWIDLDGKFTDVSELISAQSDYSGLIQHSDPMFTSDGYFYFSAGSNEWKYVPVDDLTPDAVKSIEKGQIVAPTHIGTMLHSEGSGFLVSPEFFYDNDMTYSADSDYFYDFVDEDTVVGTGEYDGTIVKYELAGDKGSNSSAVKLTPETNGRYGECPVVSPDGEEVAFFSYLTGGDDTAKYIYLVSIDGGDPEKVATGYAVPQEYGSIWSNQGSLSVYLIDWI